MAKKVTMQQIADAAGVSKFAVSRALTGKPGVSEYTREMIVKTAAQLGYFKAEPKRYPIEQSVEQDNLSDNTGTILVLFPNIRSQNRSSLYWGPVFDGISARLNEKGLDILTLTEPSSDRMFSMLNPEAIRGIITVGAISASVLLEIYRLRIPLVMVDHEEPAVHADTVFTDNVKCMRELVLMLIGKGYRHFQFAGELPDAASFRERWFGYRSVLEEMQIQSNQQPGLLGPDNDHIRKAIEEMRFEDLPEVFVCANDFTAVVVLRALKNKGIDVPGRCSVTGFDNTRAEEQIMASVHIDKEHLGKRAVDHLLWRIEHPDQPLERKLIYSELVVNDMHQTKLL
ncbi:LacI family DNA-binding transcriptional regulator [Paenibacillus sp. DCT19]|uniref:LacI family DNA-binding transcriptional regulator n=1 Tax=Paenibacillus sp. DCT19 TaxID=2211212 RepID=UPI000FE213AB|nr:LacI family DNA-binding transcriptional regulator [Paenibacillus sp. DCT19]